jgi:hypothetical protein
VKKVGINRSTFYNHIEDPSLGFDVLERYGMAIGYDFTADIPEMPKYTVEEPVEMFGQPSTIEEAIQQSDYWKNKYIVLLEKHQRLIEETMGRK